VSSAKEAHSDRFEPELAQPAETSEPQVKLILPPQPYMKKAISCEIAFFIARLTSLQPSTRPVLR